MEQGNKGFDSAGLGLDPELVLDLFDDTAAAGDQLARIRDTLDMQLRDRRGTDRAVTDVSTTAPART